METRRIVFTPSTIRFAFSLLSAMLFALCVPAEAQQLEKVPQVGVLVSAPCASGASLSFLKPFREGLRELGYMDGQNLAFEHRYTEAVGERLPSLAGELVRLKVDVIVVQGTAPALAAKQHTSTIPIVMTHVGDPVARGLIVSLARPGGNITGLTSASPDLSGKRLELLK